MPDLLSFKADHDYSDDDGVKWLPPWSFAERERWVEANPGLMGFYFGGTVGIVFGAYGTIRTRVGIGIFVGLSTLACLWPLFTLSVIRRWFVRPNAENVDFASAIADPGVDYPTGFCGCTHGSRPSAPSSRVTDSSPGQLG